MKLGTTLEISSRKAWRTWLAKNHKKETEIWLVYNRKSSGKDRISYNDAVEEALCYGWIDSTVKSLDDMRFVQRFSPRKPTSKLSEMNKQRVRKLIAAKKMTTAGLKAIAKVYDSAAESKFSIPKDIENALKKNEAAWKNFTKFPESYKRIRVAYIESRKRHGDEFYKKALKHFIEMTAKNKRFGFVKEMR
jgi:uncharacterized protein YdeI (YjbR/CyaY-like superfamily)